MNNKGKVSVFLCLMMSAILILASATYSITDMYLAKEKVVMDTRTALSNVKAEYNSYIFEHYHILAFDMNPDGKGIGELERKIEQNLKENLGKNFKVNQVAVVEENDLLESDFQYFKEQINEITPFIVADAGVEKIREKTGGKDGTLPEDVKSDMADAEKQKGDSKEDNKGGDKGEEKGSGDEKKPKTKDPRKFTKKLKKSGIMHFVVPEDLEVNGESVDLDDVVSARYKNIPSVYSEANLKFDDYNDLKKDLKNHASWNDKLLDAGEGVLYAGTFFNNAVDEKVNDETVFEFEQEYLICGYKSDYNNLKSVINRLVAIRFPLNYACLAKDVKKMAQLYEIAGPLSIITLIPAPVLKYLLAGCWAYVESIADVRQLLHGKKIDFMKTTSDWITDIDNLGTSVMEDRESSENGMGYSDYLMILMAMERDGIYFRMLDLMELNVRQYDEKFHIDEWGVSIRIDVEAEHGGKKIYVNEQGEY